MRRGDIDLPIIHNRTRYNSGDLEHVLRTVFKRSNWHFLGVLDVSYYEPSKARREDYHSDNGHTSSGRKGLYVKLWGNGDGKDGILPRKPLGIVKPTRSKFRELPELEQLACATSGGAPDILVDQLLLRLFWMRQRSRRVDWVSPFTVREARWERVAQLREEHGFRLRFEQKEPSKEELDHRAQVVQAQENILKARSNRSAFESQVRRAMWRHARDQRDKEQAQRDMRAAQQALEEWQKKLAELQQGRD